MASPNRMDPDKDNCIEHLQSTIYWHAHPLAETLQWATSAGWAGMQSEEAAVQSPAAEQGSAAAIVRARPLLWLRLTPHRMSHRRVLLSTAISSLSLWRPMGSKLSLTEPCATAKCSKDQACIPVMLTFTRKQSFA